MASINSFFDLRNITNNCTWCTASNQNDTTEESLISTGLRTGISAYYCFIIVASVTCNTALITIIATAKQLRTMSHLFIVNLAISNLFTSLLYLPFDVEKHLRGGFFPHGQFLCGVYQLSFMLSLPLSTINLLLLTLESFITIAYPYKRARLVNRRNVTIIVMLAYLYAFTYTLFPVLQHQQHSVVVDKENGICYVKFSLTYIYYFVVINLFVPLTVIIILNLIIFNIANNHTKQIRSFHTVTGVVDRPLYTPTTQRTGAEYTEMMQPSEVFLPDGSPTPNYNKERRISFNPDILPNIEPPSKFNALSSDATSKTEVNGSQQRGHSIISKITPSFLQTKRYSVDSYSSSDGTTSSTIQINKERRNSQPPTFVCNIKAAKRIALLVGECIFCWLFYIIIVFINISGKWKDPTWNPILTQIGMMINCSTLFLNPLVYGLMNPKVRAVVIETSVFIIRGCRRENKFSAPYQTSESNNARRRFSSQVESVLRKMTFSSDS